MALVCGGALILTCGGKITIGDDCSFNPYCVIYGHGNLAIGNCVRIATQTVIIPANHNFDRRDLPIHRQGLSMKGVRIGDDVWIGAGVKILDGVEIGSGSVIAAGAVVTRAVAPFTIVAGVPARAVKTRD
jgi:acetyltransferase-like isoleucine patch superfamily enzyme